MNYSIPVQGDQHRDLIASDRVEGANVYRPDGEKIGHITRLMIEKKTGIVRFAIMNFGGFLGDGEGHYPLPWSMLTYSRDLGGYEVALTDEQIRHAPKIDDEANWDWSDAGSRQRVADYYGVSIWLID